MLPSDPSLRVAARELLLVETLHTLLAVLESRPDLAARLRALFVVTQAASPPSSPFMSIAEYARHARISVRSVQSLRREMTEGEHYHRDGRLGRRVIVHVAEADAWRTARRPPASHRAALDQLASDEVSRRRARGVRGVGAAAR